MTPEFTSEDIRFMAEAIALAKQAAVLGEVPIGCVITKDHAAVFISYPSGLILYSLFPSLIPLNITLCLASLLIFQVLKNTCISTNGYIVVFPASEW